MNVGQRDIVLLPVPFSDQSSQKVRPAVVVSNDTLNAQGEDVILVPLTSVLSSSVRSMVHEGCQRGKQQWGGVGARVSEAANSSKSASNLYKRQ